MVRLCIIIKLEFVKNLSLKGTVILVSIVDPILFDQLEGIGTNYTNQKRFKSIFEVQFVRMYVLCKYLHSVKGDFRRYTGIYTNTNLDF